MKVLLLESFATYSIRHPRNKIENDINQLFMDSDEYRYTALD